MSSIDRVIVTGASSGIGFDIARAFLEAGSRVIVNGRDEAKLAAACGPAVRARRAGVRRPGAIGDDATGAKLAEAARQLGGADVLVNNAGIFGLRPFLESTADDLDRFYTTNVRGTFLVTRAVVPLLLEAGGGSVINLGTVMVDQPTFRPAVLGGDGEQGGVHALTRSLAVELAGRGDPGQRHRARHHPHPVDWRRGAGRARRDPPPEAGGRGRLHDPGRCSWPGRRS